MGRSLWKMFGKDQSVQKLASAYAVGRRLNKSNYLWSLMVKSCDFQSVHRALLHVHHHLRPTEMRLTAVFDWSRQLADQQKQFFHWLESLWCCFISLSGGPKAAAASTRIPFAAPWLTQYFFVFKLCCCFFCFVLLEFCSEGTSFPQALPVCFTTEKPQIGPAPYLNCLKAV